MNQSAEQKKESKSREKKNANSDEEMKEGYGQLQEQRSPCPDLRERDASSGSERVFGKTLTLGERETLEILGGFVCIGSKEEPPKAETERGFCSCKRGDSNSTTDLPPKPIVSVVHRTTEVPFISPNLWPIIISILTIHPDRWPTLAINC